MSSQCIDLPSHWLLHWDIDQPLHWLLHWAIEQPLHWLQWAIEQPSYWLLHWALEQPLHWLQWAIDQPSYWLLHWALEQPLPPKALRSSISSPLLSSATLRRDALRSSQRPCGARLCRLRRGPWTGLCADGTQTQHALVGLRNSRVDGSGYGRCNSRKRLTPLQQYA